MITNINYQLLQMTPNANFGPTSKPIVGDETTLKSNIIMYFKQKYYLLYFSSNSVIIFCALRIGSADLAAVQVSSQ